MSEEPEHVQDPLLPPDWHAWENGPSNAPSWHARPPGSPDPYTYIHGATKQEVCDKAWAAHRRATSKRQKHG